MADYYVSTWSRGLSSEANDGTGDASVSQYTVAFNDPAFLNAAGAYVPIVSGDRIHFAQGSGNKKPYLPDCAVLTSSTLATASTFTLAYGDGPPAAIATNEQVFLTGVVNAGGTAKQDRPVTFTGDTPTDYIANNAVVVSDTNKDYYVKVTGATLATNVGNLVISLAVIPNTGMAPQQ